MTRKERLERIIRREKADRPAVNFYEAGGFLVDTEDPDEYNIYNSESWIKLLEITEEESDIIRMVPPDIVERNPAYNDFFHTEVYEKDNSRFTRTTLKAGGREMYSLTRRDKELDTIWTIKHLLENEEDLKTYMSLPQEVFQAEYTVDNLKKVEAGLGDRGIVMVDTGDPICMAADLFEFGTFTLMAFTEPLLFHKLLEKLSEHILERTQFASENFPGHLWRIYGPEYATEPYLPPKMFKEYVQRYTGPMVEIIHKYDGIVRLHSHGKINNVLNYMVEMGADAVDPVEPAPQGDVSLEYMAENYGDKLVLFGNIEITDIMNLSPDDFEKIVRQSVGEGKKAEGFVLMPSASPYGREIPESAIENYRTMIRVVKEMET